MSRAYLVYFVMAAMLAGGLWLVLTLGESLRAPDDLSGNWTVHWDQPPHSVPQDSVMHIDQSGRYLTVRFENGPMWRFKLQENWRGARDGQHLAMNFDGDVYHMSCTGTIPATQQRRVDSLQLHVLGKLTHTGYASRKLDNVAKGQDSSAPVAPAKTADAR